MRKITSQLERIEEIVAEKQATKDYDVSIVRVVMDDGEEIELEPCGMEPRSSGSM